MRFRRQPSDRCIRLRDDGKPALIFAAHLANWELPALARARYGLDTTVLYRRPNIAGRRRRGDRDCAPAAWATLIPTGLDAPMQLAEALRARRACRACWSTSTTAAAST